MTTIFALFSHLEVRWQLPVELTHKDATHKHWLLMRPFFFGASSGRGPFRDAVVVGIVLPMRRCPQQTKVKHLNAWTLATASRYETPRKVNFDELGFLAW